MTTVKFSLDCTYRGCDGRILVSDEQCVYDGEVGECDTCCRAYVAVAYEGGCFKMEFDPEETMKRMPRTRSK